MPNKYSGALSFINDIGPLPSIDDGMPEPDPMNQPVPNATLPPLPPWGITEQTPSGIVLPKTGAELMPDIGTMPFERQQDDETSWDQQVERLPVYEYQGQRIVGDLRWAPEWPQNLQPVDYVMVPRSGTEWKQS